MPTYDALDRFWNEYHSLSETQKSLFSRAIREFIEDLRIHRGQRFRPRLRIRGVHGFPGIFEMTWDSDGRATFSFGQSPLAGEAHIIWRRIGDHSIFNNP